MGRWSKTCMKKAVAKGYGKNLSVNEQVVKNM